MFLYFLLLTIMNALIFTAVNKKISPSLISLLCMFLFIVSALRFDTGIDCSTYQQIFYNPTPAITAKEKGFMLINEWIKALGFSFQPVLFIFSFLTILLLNRYILRKSANPALSLFIFFTYTPFYLETFNGLRQAVVIYIFLCSLKFIKERKFLPYCSVIIISAFFAHASAVILIPLYFVSNMRFSRFGRLFLISSSLFGSFALIRLVEYTPWAIYLKVTVPHNVLSPVFCFNVFLCVCLLLFVPYTDENKIEWNHCLFALCFLLMSIALRNSPLYIVTTRFNEYFLVTFIILVPLLIERQKRYKSILTLLAAACFSGIFTLSILMHGEQNELVPYKMFFGKFNEPVVYDILILVIFISIYALKIFSGRYVNERKY